MLHYFFISFIDGSRGRFAGNRVVHQEESEFDLARQTQEISQMNGGLVVILLWKRITQAQYMGFVKYMTALHGPRPENVLSIEKPRP